MLLYVFVCIIREKRKEFILRTTRALCSRGFGKEANSFKPVLRVHAIFMFIQTTPFSYFNYFILILLLVFIFCFHSYLERYSVYLQLAKTCQSRLSDKWWIKAMALRLLASWTGCDGFGTMDSRFVEKLQKLFILALLCRIP